MNIGGAIERGTVSITKDWTTYKKKMIRDETRAERFLEEMMRGQTRERSIKSLAYEYMPRAYVVASAKGTYPAHARQVFYQARPLILEHTEKRVDDQYFTQTLLPDYMDEHPGTTGNWDVVFDARGHLWEPHTKREVPLGTLQVRQYLRDIAGYKPPEWTAPMLDLDYPTIGPENRYLNVLFVEKEGFLPLFHAVKLAERFDLAIMSTKGLSTTAARTLLEKMRGVRFLVLHDFDKSGFSIASTLQRDTRRYRFANPPEVIDFGLRLADVEAERLDPEPVHYKERDPRANLRKNGATKAEIDYLFTGYGRGQRVELNALPSDRLVAWIERKLTEHNVEKIVPEKETLTGAFRRAAYVHFMNQRIAELHDQAVQVAEAIKVPRELRKQITAHLEENPGEAWDAAVAEIAGEALHESDGVAPAKQKRPQRRSKPK